MTLSYLVIFAKTLFPLFSKLYCDILGVWTLIYSFFGGVTVQLMVGSLRTNLVNTFIKN